MNPRELATVLAALRHWQNALAETKAGDLSPFHFSGGEKPLTIQEIDDLSERLNCNDSALGAGPKTGKGRQDEHTGPKRMFKVWVYVEAIDDDAGAYHDLMDLGFLEPVSLGPFDHLKEAWAFVLSLPGCQSDDSDLRALIGAAEIENEVWESPARQEPRYEGNQDGARKEGTS